MLNKILIPCNHGMRAIDPDSILYFASDYGQIILHYENEGKEEILIFTGRLKLIEKQLEPSGFIRIHRSFIISARKITYIERESVILKAGRKIRLPIGKIYAEDLRKKLINCDMIIL